MSFITGSTITAIPVTVPQGGTGQTSLTANNVLLGNGSSAVQLVAPGTSGNVLQSNGTTWASAAAGSDIKLIQTQDAAGSSFIEFTGMNVYNNYRVVISSYIASLQPLEMRWGHSGGLYSVSSFTTSGIYLDSVALQRLYNVGSLPYIITSATSATSQYGASGYIDFFDTATTGKYVKSISNVGFYFNTGPAWTFQQYWIVCATTSGFDRVRFLPSSGTFTSGLFSLYGILQ
jgi:hypothetical protein